MLKPLAIDLFCGLGGWTEGLLAEGYRVVGFDVERHRYPLVVRPDSPEKLPGNNSARRWADRPVKRLADASGEFVPNEWMEYPAQLVLQDVLTIHGSKFKDAALIVASPPCQEYSYMAMPWSRAKQIQREYEDGTRDKKQLTALFDACFRIQQEACEAAGHHIPLVVENVRGAQKWVGRSRWNFGSFHLWGDVPALMPNAMPSRKTPEGSWDKTRKNYNPDHSWDGGLKGAGDGWFNDAKRKGGTKTGRLSQTGSKSPARKAASAMIAKIPLVLSRWVARTYYPC